MEKLRVVHVLYSFETGGMEKGIATLAQHASELFEHIILCLSTSGESERLLPPDTQLLELHKPPGNSPLFLLKLVRTLKSLQPAVVHTRDWGGTDGIIAARLAGIRQIVQGEHGWVVQDATGHNLKRLKIRRFLSRWVKEFTCVSKHQEKWLRDEVQIRTNITQIYNGVDTQTFCPGHGGMKIRTEFGIPEDAFIIGIVGRLDPIKDHPTLFEAFAKLQKESPESRLLVIGDGSDRGRLESLAGNGVLFLGNRTDIPEILQALNVFVLPSLNEGISNTILEAMATGLPVIATDVGGNGELVEDGNTGVLVPVGASEAIASALLNYLKSDALCHAHGKNGRIKTRQSFSIENMVHSYEAVYQRVASVGR